MRKIFLILCLVVCTFINILPVGATADKLVLKYNAQNSNENLLSIDIYFQNPGNFQTERYESLYIYLALYDGDVEVTKDYFSSATAQVSLSGGTNNICKMNSGNKRILISYLADSAENYISWNSETGHLATFNISLSKEINKELTFKTVSATYKRVSDAAKINIVNQEFDKIYPYTESSTSPYLLDIAQTLANQNNEIINSSNINSTTKINFGVSKLVSDNVNATFIAAFYNDDETLEFAEIATQVIDEEDDNVEITLTKTPTTASKIRLFAWDGISTLVPISESKEYIIIE